MKNFKVIVVLLLSLFVGFVFLSTKIVKIENNLKPTVSVSTFALYDIAKHIGGDKVNIINILPFGVDPHSFELTPKLMGSIENSDIVFYSGAGLEPWTHSFAFKSKVIDMSKFVNLRKLGKNEFEHHKHHDEQCVHNSIDPHYWLDFNNMKNMVDIVTHEFIIISPKNKQFFLENKKLYVKMLDSLNKKYKNTLSKCKVNTVVLNHNAIGYLANNYNFNVESLSGFSPESDPTANDMKRVMKKITSRGITTIFFENFVNSRSMKSIASDMHVNLDVIQPLGNITADEFKKNLTYENIMLLNLKKLSKALMCK